MPSWDILSITFVHTLNALFQPLFWLIVSFIVFQYWQLQRNQQYMFGEAKYSLQNMIFYAVGCGLVGGLVGSLLLLIVGVTLNELGFEYLWPLALLLMFFHLRYVCFAYAGGLVSLSSVLFGWPQVHVPSLIALVAILHITESLLIAISGRNGSIPLIMRTEQGKLVGGFQLQNFWPLPLTILQSVILSTSGVGNLFLSMPSWWPLLQHEVSVMPDQVLAYMPVAIVAALGYADVAVASQPADRRLRSAKHLFLYSITLLILALVSNRYHLLQILAAVLAPLGHEYLIWLVNKREKYGEPLFQQAPDGVMILDTFKDTPAAKMGLKPGDVILRINDRAVYRRMDIAEVLLDAGREVILEVRTSQGIKRYEGLLAPEKRLGTITVPEGDETNYVEVQQNSAFGVLKQLGQRIFPK
jgi:hypothetical protein